MEYLAEQHKKNSPLTLAEFMARMRFDLGKDKRNGFGTPTEYEKAAFAGLLMSEAGGKAREAAQRYDDMQKARANGRAAYVNPQTVKTVQQMAEDARNWYESLLALKYPLREQTVREIEDTMKEMEHIISRCKRWFTATDTGGTTPGGR